MVSEDQPAPNQRHHWNLLHQQGAIDPSSLTPTEFAVEVQQRLVGKLNILEIGCGYGNDSTYFAQQGANVTAIDFSEVAIEKAQAAFPDFPNLHFEVGDTSQPFRFPAQAFDVVYARLSLHYFTDAVTRQIFAEIHRILRQGGLLCFMCKSTQDSLCGQGRELEPDMYEFNAHVRHFFSEAYARECLDGKYQIEQIASEEGQLYDRQSAYVKVIARKTR